SFTYCVAVSQDSTPAQTRRSEVKSLLDAADKLSKEQKFDEALEKYFAAAKLQAEIGDERGAAKSNLNIAVLLNDSDPARALEFGERALVVFTKLEGGQWSALTMTIVGSAQGKLGRHEKAVESFTSAANAAH